MTQVPIRTMINSGSWFQCESAPMLGRARQFRLRISSFRPVELAEIDNAENIKDIVLQEGQLWILSFSAVNLGKVQFDPVEVRYSFVLTDQDECDFSYVEDIHLTRRSDFALKTGLHRFHGLCAPLAPKMVVVGAAVYLLPDQEPSQYALKMKTPGTIEEL